MSVFPIDFQDGVNDFDVGVNETMFFSSVCPMTHMNATKLSVIKCGLNAKIVIESDLCANSCIFALINVSSHYRSPFHANDCVFSCNEQQKVYFNLLTFIGSRITRARLKVSS